MGWTMDRRIFLKGSAAAGAAACLGAWPDRDAFAQARAETLRVVAEGRPNSLDPHGTGVSPASLGTFSNVYDRLIQFDRREVSAGLYRYDYARFTGELAQAWEESDEGRSLVFHLRPDATFHDGAPVTAEDVRWSLARGVSLPASKNQLATGSLKDAAQFEVVDAHTLRIRFDRKDRLTLPNLALTFASVINSALVKSHATEADRWGAEWLRSNEAGSGAYRVETWNPSQQVVYSRFDGWKGGALPYLKRAIVQVVPAASSRVATLRKGDADIALQLPPRDIDAIAGDKAVKVVSLPVTNSFRFVAFNTRQKPFDDVRVRQAIAYALPYKDLLEGAVFGHGTPLYGAKSRVPAEASFPQAFPYDTDLDKARALLAEAGLGSGFETTFSYNVADATIADPIARLVKEALGKLGVKVTIEKVAEAQWGALLTQRKVPFYVEASSAWFNDPDYFFRIFFQGDWRWNFGNFQDEELDELVNAARWETDHARYDEAIRKAIGIVFDKVPIVLLWLPSFEAALQPRLDGFTYYIHGQVDFRTLRSA